HYGLDELYEVDATQSEADLVSQVGERLRQGGPTLFYMLRPVAFPGGLRLSDHARFLEGTEVLLTLSFVRNVVRGDFIAYHPEAAKILSRYKISGEDIGLSMQRIAEAGDSKEVLTDIARRWIEENRSEVDSWLEGLRGRERPETLPEETLPVAYSLDKEELFLDLAIEFNLSRPAGTLPVEPVRRHMEDMLDEAMAGEYAAISPDSSVWLDQLDLMWEESGRGGSALIGATTSYAVSPLVIAMRESQAAAMGHPAEAIGWADLMERASTDPEFRWSHASAATASGLLALTAEFYGGAEKQAGLTVADLRDETTREFVRNVESTVRRYGGEPENYVMMRMLAEGGLPLDAFAVTERWVVYFNRHSDEERLVAIYPEEGTFWMDHPLVLLEGPWVSEGQKQAFHAFADFTTSPQGQGAILGEGYRPAGAPMALYPDSLIRPENGVDPAEPTALLGMPEAQVLQSVREAWRSLKKPANIYLVVDVSGSMRGERIARAKEALVTFIDEVVGDRDQVALVAFSDDVRELQGLKPLDKGSLKRSISTLNTAGGTQLYEAVAFAYDKLQDQGELDRINVIVAMTDGQSSGDISIVESRLREPDFPVLVFTVAYGDEPELDVLDRIALMGEGQAYPSDPRTIKRLYLVLSAFF
ncbi:MAG: VWA domain-containing protein, partial [Chloroflexi bacterium]|nr:VWA domain-containing protein [Chloroflexota bacterium]